MNVFILVLAHPAIQKGALNGLLLFLTKQFDMHSKDELRNWRCVM